MNNKSYQMKLWIVILASCLVYVSLAAKHPEAKLSFEEYCKFYNYPVQSHDVITEDGYILRMFRIQKKYSQIVSGLKPIIMQHGLLDSSDTWLINDEAKAPGFMLANLGFDVWLGNSRGNKHSRRHQTLNPDKDKAFWDFTLQHMADFDIPAIFKYVNQITGQKIHYVGHSQGTIQMHVALSKNNPVVESLMDKYFAFGPVAYIKYMTSPLIDLLDKSGMITWYHIRKIYEFMPSPDWFETDVGVAFCGAFGKICADVLKYVMDADPSVDNYDRYDVLVGHDPSGTSVMNMEHWKQMFDTGKFQAYDYGNAKENINHYGTAYPPVWNLNNIKVPVRLFAGSSDELADPQDVNFLWDSLKPESKTFFRMYNAGHCTFMWGVTVKPWMDDLVSYLRQ